jgi:DNA polymerase-4
MPKTIFYIDPPAFCATVERLVAPALASRPIAVAPPGADRATILALSPEARAAGIVRGMLVRRARKLCPDLVLLPPNPRLYARASRALTGILRVYAPVIEPRGYGHAFLDLSGTERLFGPAVDLAERIRRESRERLRLPLTVGVAVNKLVSEAATRAGRQDGMTAGRLGGLWPRLVEHGAEAEFLAPHPLEVLPEVPDDIRVRLEEYQLALIGQVAKIGESGLAAVFGRRGRLLAAQARGIDARPVLPPEVKAEYRVAHTLATDTNDLGVLDPLLRRLTETLGQRLRQRRLAARRLLVQIDYADYSHATRSVPLGNEPLDHELWQAARQAMGLARSRRIAVRRVTVTVDRLVEANPQLELFTGGTGRDRAAAALQQALDAIRTVKSGLPGQHDLANAPVRLHLPVGRRDLRHGKDRVHHGAERLGPPLGASLAAERLLGRNVGTEAGQHPDPEIPDQRAPLAQLAGAHHRPDHGEPLAEHQRQVRFRRDRTLQQAQDDQPAPGGEYHQVIGEGRPAQHVQDHVHRRVELVPERLAAGVDTPVHAEPLERGEFAPGARGADDRGARLVGELDRGGADPARRGVNQHPLARLEVAPQGERVVGGEKRLGNRRRIGHREFGRRRQHLVLVHHHELGVGAAAHQPHHRVTGFPAGYVGTHLVHRAGVLQPGDVGGPAGRSGIAAPALENVGPVESGSVNPDPDLAGAGLGGGDLAEGEDFGPTASSMHDGAHDGDKV